MAVPVRSSGRAAMEHTADSLSTDGHTIGRTGVYRSAVGEHKRICAL